MVGSRRPPSESTATLLTRVRAGDAAARNRLFARYLPMLQAWAHGRLPANARNLSDTDDLVQITLIRALNRVEAFVPTREGAFLAYLRQILLNAVREQIRRSRRRGDQEPVTEELPGTGPSLIEELVGRELLASYEEALVTLDARQREAVILRVEFGFDYGEIAEAIGSPSRNAARMVVSRALVRLSEAMNEQSKDEA